MNLETLTVINVLLLGLMAILSTALAAVILYGVVAFTRIAYAEIKNLIKKL